MSRTLLSHLQAVDAQLVEAFINRGLTLKRHLIKQKATTGLPLKKK